MRGWGLLWLVACGASGETDSGSQSLMAAWAAAGPDLAGPVGTALTFDGSGSVGERFVWDFGDGQTADGPVATHTYATPGNYTAVLQVIGQDGAPRTDTASVIAHRPLIAPRPTYAGAIPQLADRHWVVVPEAGVLVGVGSDDRVDLPVCDEPLQVAVGDSELWVICADDQLLRVSADPLAVVEAVALPRACHPRGLVARGTDVRVACSGTGQVWDPATGSAEAAVDDVRAMAWGTALLALPFRGADGVQAVPGTPIAIAPSEGPDTDTSTRGVVTRVDQALLDPSGTVLYLAGMIGNTERGLWRDGQKLTFETTVRAVVDAYEVESGLRLWRKQLDDHGYVGPLAISPLGDRLYVAGPSNRDVTVLDAYDGDIVASVLDAGLGIRGLSVDDRELRVDAWLDRALRVYDLDDLSAPTRVVPTVTDEPLSDEVLLGKHVFWDATDIRMSKAGYLSCIVCHPDGEHDGLTWDFTDRGEGLRNTTSLVGGGNPETGLLHWTGNFDEFQDFEGDVRIHFGGRGFLDDAQWAAGSTSQSLGDPKAGLNASLDGLAAYLDSLTEWPVAPEEASAADLTLLTDAGCTSCHSGVAYTDSSSGARHDVGTLTEASGQRLGVPMDGLDTPTLRGVWRTGPWLHDGSASSLTNAIVRHNVGLSVDEAEALAEVVSKL